MDSLSPAEAFLADDALGEVAISDLNALFAAAISRLADWLVHPPAQPDVMMTCVQALRQLHLTAANELQRLQQQLDGKR